MKRNLLLGTVLILSSALQLSAQFSSLEQKIKKVPAHVEERLSEYDRIIPPGSIIKNSSYDTPMTIERYAVDALEVQTLDRVYQLTYLPGGQLRTQTRMDGMLNNQFRTIFNYDGVGEISSIIYQFWNGGGWEFDYREVYTYTTEGYISSLLFEEYNMGDWDHDGEQQYTYERTGSNITALLVMESSDGLTWSNSARFDYTYNSGNSTPSEILISTWNEDYLSNMPYEKLEISNWGSIPFKPDYYFNSYRLNYKITDAVINKISEYNFYYPAADFVLHAGYNFEDGTFAFQANLYSEFVDDNRTELTIEIWNGTMYEPADRVLQQYDECYGYSGMLTQEYIVPTGWQLDGGAIFVGETTPYNESCYVTAYNYYSSFSAMNPTGNWTRRWVINQFSNLSLNENELNNNLQVFPNPSTDEVTVNFTGDFTSDFKLTIIGLDGKTHYATTMSSSVQHVDVSQLPAGMYTIVLENDNTVLTEKIIKR